MRSSDPVSHFGELTVASFRTWRSWAPYSCTGLDLSGADRGRTDDLLVANEALSQLSYSPDKATKNEEAKRKRARNDLYFDKITNQREKSNFVPLGHLVCEAGKSIAFFWRFLYIILYLLPLCNG